MEPLLRLHVGASGLPISPIEHSGASSSATHLCGLGQVSLPLCASVSSTVRFG